MPLRGIYYFVVKYGEYVKWMSKRYNNCDIYLRTKTRISGYCEFIEEKYIIKGKFVNGLLEGFVFQQSLHERISSTEGNWHNGINTGRIKSITHNGIFIEHNEAYTIRSGGKRLKLANNITESEYFYDTEDGIEYVKCYDVELMKIYMNQIIRQHIVMRDISRGGDVNLYNGGMYSLDGHNF